MEQNKPKYLIRPHDFCIWELHEATGRYQPRFKIPLENRQEPYNHWDYNSLVNYYDFFPIEDSEMEYYEKKNDYEMAFISWQSRNDGHGGSKGGTKSEYVNYLERVKEFNVEHPDWKEERDKRNEKARKAREDDT